MAKNKKTIKDLRVEKKMLEEKQDKILVKIGKIDNKINKHNKKHELKERRKYIGRCYGKCSGGITKVIKILKIDYDDCNRAICKVLDDSDLLTDKSIVIDSLELWEDDKKDNSFLEVFGDLFSSNLLCTYTPISKKKFKKFEKSLLRNLRKAY